MSDPSSNGSPNGNGSGNGAPSATLARLPGETGTAYRNRQDEAKIQQEREAQEARAQQERERLDALMHQAAQLVQTLQRAAAAIPPDLSGQLAAVRSELQEARSAAVQVRTAATSAGETVTATAQQFATVTAQAREWHTALTAAMQQIARTLQAAERSARASHERAASMVTGLMWRVWATATGSPAAVLLLLGLLLWAADPLRASVAEWLMTDAQRNHVLNGAAIEGAYQSPRATVVDRCLMESYVGWQRRAPCPAPPPGSGLNASTRPTPKRGR